MDKSIKSTGTNNTYRWEANIPESDKLWRDSVIEQIIVLRDEESINMLDLEAVLSMALEKGFVELADFMFMYRGNYKKFLETGNTKLVTLIPSTLVPAWFVGLTRSWVFPIDKKNK